MNLSSIDENELCTAYNTVDLNATAVLSLYMYDYIYSPVEWYLYRYVYPCLVTIGLLTNCSFIFVVARVPCMRNNITNFYLINLAVIDLLYLLVAVVSDIVLYNLYPIRFAAKNLAVCRLDFFVSSFCFAAATNLITLVTFERYMAICHPMRHHIVKGWQRTVKLTVAAWIMCAGFNMPSLAFYSSLDYFCVRWPPTEDYDSYDYLYQKCSYRLHDARNGVMTIAVLTGALWSIEALACIAMYIQIIHQLHKRSKSDYAIADPHAASTRNQVAVMLIVNGSFFYACCCFTSVHLVFLIILQFGSANEYPLSGYQLMVFKLAGALAYIISCIINPVIYSVTNRKYREAFWVAICGCRFSG